MNKSVHYHNKNKCIFPLEILKSVIIFHIVVCRKAGNGDSFEMRWVPAEDFTEIRIMPKMLLDHLPENVYKTLDTVINEQRTEIVDYDGIAVI